MKIKHLFKQAFLLLLYAISPIVFLKSKQPKNAITYELTGGRFGDTLLNYIKCKYFAAKYDLLFFYRPFLFSDQLRMHVDEKYLSSLDLTQFKEINSIHLYKQPEKTDSILYVSNFYTETPDNFIEYIIQDKALYAEIKRMINPREKLSFSLPSDKTSIAVHVRKGGGFDRPLLSGSSSNDAPDPVKYIDCCHPLKFPPDSFYISQIRFISEQLENKPLYVYIFTDDKNPQNIAETYRQAVNKENIVFDYCRKNEPFDNHLIHDLFFMKKFDCLIRPESAFSIIAQVIGNHKIVISPSTYHWEGSTLIIDEANYAERCDDNMTYRTISLNNKVN